MVPLEIPPIVLLIPNEAYESMMTSSFDECKEEIIKNINKTEDEEKLLGILLLMTGMQFKRIPFAQQIKDLAGQT